MSPPSYIIVGCGHFGRRAAEQLLEKDPRSKIIVVDKSPLAVQRLTHLPVETIVDDGLSFLDRFLSEERRTSYIIPSAPFHLAFEFILLRMKPFGAARREVPPIPGLPNPRKGRRGDLYVSLANFLCPEDCPGPARYCAVTRKQREKPLYQILKELKGPFESRVIISEQLSPGVGGYRGSALLDLLGGVKKRKPSAKLILISTASRCHGVTSALSFT